MISLDLARRLQDAGMVWTAKPNDFFVVPDRGMDERIFVITEIMANLDVFRGWPVVTFHGSAEWALDYILTTEVIWLPTEEQLRTELENQLLGEPDVVLALAYSAEGYACTFQYQSDTPTTLRGSDASEAYGLALLHILSADK